MKIRRILNRKDQSLRQPRRFSFGTIWANFRHVRAVLSLVKVVDLHSDGPWPSVCLNPRYQLGNFVLSESDVKLITTRESVRLCCCAVEASMASEHLSWTVLLNMWFQANLRYKTNGELDQGFAKTVARIIGMIYQRKTHVGEEFFNPDSKAYARSKYP